jgi:ketosteroid isomerase-like protein
MINRREFIVVMCVLFAGSFGAAAAGDSATNDAEQVSRLQSELVDAYIHHDISALQRILADDYVFTNDRGEVETKEKVLANFKTGGDRTISSYVIHDPKVRVYGDAAIMTYRYTSKEQYKGRDEGGTFRITRVFIRMGNGWQMVAGHETRIVKPASNSSLE